MLAKSESDSVANVSCYYQTQTLKIDMHAAEVYYAGSFDQHDHLKYPVY
jgi:hypothetical protein